MTLKDLNEESVKKLSNSELMNLHYRVHQLYSLSKKRNSSKEFTRMLLKYHTILENEIKRRNLKHRTPLVESYLERLFKESEDA